MKNYLLKIASVSFLCFSLLTSCSDDDDSTEETEEITEETPEEMLEGTSEVNLTNCYSCPSFSVVQETASNPEPVTINEPAVTVCEGDDGKAYINGELNDLNQSFEEYLRIRQMSSRCSAN